jgi:hypothetical protein
LPNSECKIRAKLAANDCFGQIAARGSKIVISASDSPQKSFAAQLQSDAIESAANLNIPTLIAACAKSPGRRQLSLLFRLTSLY